MNPHALSQVFLEMIHHELESPFRLLLVGFQDSIRDHFLAPFRGLLEFGLGSFGLQVYVNQKFQNNPTELLDRKNHSFSIPRARVTKPV